MHIELFDDKAHEVVSDLIDRSEMWMIRKGICKPDSANEHLTLRYIETCNSFMNHAQCYLENDEQIAADVFLWELNKAAKARKASRTIRNAARQLAKHTDIYFASFRPLLRLTFLKVLAETVDHDELRRSGVVLLAAATLPGARTDIRRELRRRGATFESLLVPDDVYERTIEQIPLFANSIEHLSKSLELN